MYPTPDVNSTTQLLQYVNTDLVAGSLGIGILILIWVVMVVRLSIKQTHMAIATASFFTSICSILLWAIGIISDYTLFICLAIALISAIALYTHET
jgi:hypothetical protein